jgi:transcription elongation factor Elf1
MVTYCKNDVVLLESVYKKLNPYVITKHHKGVFEGGEPHHCPSCGGEHVISNGIRIGATGLKKRRLHCQDCGKYFTIANSVYELVQDVLKANETRKKK